MFAVLCIAVLLGIVGSSVWCVYIIRRTVRRRRMYGGAPTPMAEALASAPGSCWLNGQVSALDEPLRAPLSGRPCVYFEIDAEPRVSNIHPRRSASHAVDFLITDGTGAARITTRSIESIELVDDYIAYERGTADAAMIDARLRQLGLLGPDDATLFSLVIRERILAAGEAVHLKGLVTREPERNPAAVSTSHGYRDMPERLLVQRCELRALRDRGQELRAAAVLDEPARERGGPVPASSDGRAG